MMSLRGHSPFFSFFSVFSVERYPATVSRLVSMRQKSISRRLFRFQRFEAANLYTSLPVRSERDSADWCGGCWKVEGVSCELKGNRRWRFFFFFFFFFWYSTVFPCRRRIQSRAN